MTETTSTAETAALSLLGEKYPVILLSTHKPGEVVWALWTRYQRETRDPPRVRRVKLGRVTITADRTGTLTVYRVHRCGCFACGYRDVLEVFDTEAEAREAWKASPKRGRAK